MIRINGIALSLDDEQACRGERTYTTGALVTAVAKALALPASDIVQVEVLRRSIDARRKTNVHFIVNVCAVLRDEAAEYDALQAGEAQEYHAYQPLDIAPVSSIHVPPVVVGTGPAGLFAALYLARAGARPLLVERGADVHTRAQIVDAFTNGGPLDEQCNIQFGEGGAGTFSDGKLTTNIKHAMRDHVLHWFAEAGAPETVLWDAHPHIGSDNLPAVVETMRQEIIERGGQVLFRTQLTGMQLEEGRVTAVELTDALGTRTQPTRQVVLAVGHSARDTFAMLHEIGFAMEQKPFSMGVRIEHPQRTINEAQWGSAACHHALGAAEYKLVYHDTAPEGEGAYDRHAYTFCMCPGGVVVCAASEQGGVVTNGMSAYARDGVNANAALLVNVDPSDFGGDDPLAGVRLQQHIEQAAYQAALKAGGAPYAAPAQTVGDFLAHNQGGPSPSSAVQPTYARGVAWCDLHEVLPDFICDTLSRALPAMDRKLQGFSDDSAVMTAPETRSSSPVHICRGQAHLQAWLGTPATTNAIPSGVYPCGEGAGYAGGIMSAACDGLRVAQRVAHDLAHGFNHDTGPATANGTTLKGGASA